MQYRLFIVVLAICQISVAQNGYNYPSPDNPLATGPSTGRPIGQPAVRPGDSGFPSPTGYQPAPIIGGSGPTTPAYSGVGGYPPAGPPSGFPASGGSSPDLPSSVLPSVGRPSSGLPQSGLPTTGFPSRPSQSDFPSAPVQPSSPGYPAGQPGQTPGGFTSPPSNGFQQRPSQQFTPSGVPSATGTTGTYPSSGRPAGQFPIVPPGSGTPIGSSGTYPTRPQSTGPFQSGTGSPTGQYPSGSTGGSGPSGLVGGFGGPGGLNEPSQSGGQDDGSYPGGDYSAIPGEPGVDYPIYTEIPETSFDCAQQQYPGYYADVEAQCQVFHICALNRTFDFLCPNGTIFSQEVLVCVWWNQFDCNSAPNFYGNNAFIYDYSQNGQQTKPSDGFGNVQQESAGSGVGQSDGFQSVTGQGQVQQNNYPGSVQPQPGSYPSSIRPGQPGTTGPSSSFPTGSSPTYPTAGRPTGPSSPSSYPAPQSPSAPSAPAGYPSGPSTNFSPSGSQFGGTATGSTGFTSGPSVGTQSSSQTLSGSYPSSAIPVSSSPGFPSSPRPQTSASGYPASTATGQTPATGPASGYPSAQRPGFAPQSDALPSPNREYLPPRRQ